MPTIVKAALLTIVLIIFPVTTVKAVDCPAGDIYGDCRINILDLKAFAEQWLDASCSGPSCADFDSVNGVNNADFLLLANNWLEAEYPIVINEFMAKNDGYILDPAGDDDDWIELYNYKDVPVDVGGMYLTDRPLEPINWWQIPTGFPLETTIEPYGHLIIWADNETGEGTLHASFAIGAGGGEDLALFDPDGVQVDLKTVNPQNSDESYGRLPDGGSTWEVFSLTGTYPPSPGQENGSPLVDIVISEIMYHPSSENDLEEYIEIYNNGASSVNLLGWQFRDGVDFTFPDVTINSNEYLVVAADVTTFSAKYPGVSNVIGNWVGKLSNKSEDIELNDDTGILVSRVDYADEGDWSERLLGALDHNQRGWEWSDEHDGGGKSLELINPDMPNEYGQNWAASTTVQGTPGVVNSVDDGDIAPLILDAKHRPIIPRSSEAVTVTAEVIDELSSGVSVTLYHRVDSSVYSQSTYPHHDPCDYTTVTMLDDGLSGDGEAGDGVYGGQIPAESDNTIVEFFIKASDSGANERSYPAPSDIDGTPEQVTNLLYQVNDSYDREVKWVPGSQRIYYLIMTNDENLRLKDIGDDEGGEAESNAQMNATFISHDGVDIKARYNVGIRNRGKSSRVGPPNNYRVNFVHERSWEDATAININFKYSHSQIMGSSVFRMAGLEASEVIPIQLRVNGDDLSEPGSRMYGTYAHQEAFGSEFVENHFPYDDDGNLYKAQSYPWISNLDYEGTDPCDYVASGYFKDTNEEENDWSDIINLTNVLDNSPDISYVEDVNSVVNIDQWLRWFAVNSLIGNNETSLGNGRGDDYRFFMGMNDRRAVLIPHDLDTVMGLGDNPNPTDDSIFRAADPCYVPVIVRFLEHPDIVPRYYDVLKELTETTFSPEQMDPLVDQTLGGFVPQLTINAIKQFVVDRVANVLTQIPLDLTATSNLSVSGDFYHTTTNSGVISGNADAINTRSVTVNGLEADWTALGAQYSFDIATSGLMLNPGVNRLVVQSFDGAGRETDHEFIDIWYDTASETTFAGGTLASDTLFDLASSPWRVTGSITIPAGITLTIEPGTSVYFNNGTSITINGRLVAEGSEYQRIRLTRVPVATSAIWNGLIFQNTLEDSRLSYLDMSYGDNRGDSILIEYSQVLLDNVSWPGSTQRALELLHPSLIARNCVFQGINGEVIHGEYIENDEYFILENNLFERGHTGGDIVDFLGADRPGPVLQVMNNIFMGGPDDGIDLDGTDAHVEGNIFMDFHKETSRDTTSNGIATGLPQSGATNRTQATIVRNVFYGNDHGILLKEDAFGTIVNNVFAGNVLAAMQLHEVGGTEVKGPATGAYLDGNIFLDNTELFKHEHPTDPCGVPLADPNIVVTRCVISSEKHSLGEGNIDINPAFVNDTSDFHLRSYSGAIGAGPNARDIGVYVPAGATVAGEPDEVTCHTDATLTVDGPGISHYIYRVKDTGSWMGGWSSEQSIGTDISLSSLQDGHSYTVYTRGRNIDDIWPDDPNGNASETWTVDITHSLLVINEVLADPNSTPYDLIELYYDGPIALNMSDMSVTDDIANPRKYVFGPGATINPGEYMVLIADPNTLLGHIGFGLDADGEGVYLYDKLSNGGGLIDSVVFGEQLHDRSIGRVGREREWTLTKPSFGWANVSEPLDNPGKLKINEWLANGEVLFDDDFVEIYNPGNQPVNLGGLYLTDDPVAEPDKHRIWPLTFVDGREYFVFRADDDPSAGSNHAHFRLSADQEMVGLYDPWLNEIDKVTYYTQTTDVSQGRSPDGGADLVFFTFPTPGIMNITDTVETTITTENLFPIDAVWSYYQDGAAPGGWNEAGFDDSGWDTGAALLYVESSSLPGPKNTPLTLGKKTYYFRRHFMITGDPNLIDELSVSAIIDDGAVFHINGIEALRHGVKEGITVTYNTMANRTINNAGIEKFSLPTDALVEGDNVIAVDVHQTDPGSSDIVFGMSLDTVKITTTITEFNPYVEEEKVLNSLRITEMMYHPDDDGDLEYIEFQNIGSEEIDITGVHFTDGIDYTFGEVTVDPNEYVVIAYDEALFESAYPGVDAVGQYTGKLNNSGESIVLKLAWPHKAAILRFDYNNTWYPSTDGGGDSLEIIDPAAFPATWDDKESWQAVTPSPGAP